MDLEKIAHWAFVAFVIIAIVMGLVVGYMVNQSYSNASNVDADVTLILLILGIIVGLIKITAKEVTPFLIAAIALIVAGISNVWGPLTVINTLLYDWATYIVHYIVAFVAPAAVIIAIKAVFAMERLKGSTSA
jgi:DMSO reductase anchor subunit